jgi:hypothetical protein
MLQLHKTILVLQTTSPNIQGHLIYEVHGKIVAQKMINSTAQEVSYAGVGRFTNGVDVAEVWYIVLCSYKALMDR